MDKYSKIHYIAIWQIVINTTVAKLLTTAELFEILCVDPRVILDNHYF